jgi:hypothetical protein
VSWRATAGAATDHLVSTSASWLPLCGQTTSITSVPGSEMMRLGTGSASAFCKKRLVLAPRTREQQWTRKGAKLAATPAAGRDATQQSALIPSASASWLPDVQDRPASAERDCAWQQQNQCDWERWLKYQRIPD